VRQMRTTPSRGGFAPYVRVAMDSRIEAPWVIGERVIWDYELLYVMEGRLAVTIEDDHYEAQPGDVFLFKPKQRHSIRLDGSGYVRQPHVHFDLDLLPDRHAVPVSFKPLDRMSREEKGWFREDWLSAPPYGMPSYYRLRNPLHLERVLFELISEYETKPPYWELRAGSCITDLVVLLAREVYRETMLRTSSQAELLLEIRDYLDRNADRPVKLEELAAHSHFSKYHLVHSFKDLFQITPMAYHQKLRMARAKDRILYSNASLSEIADSLGFSSLQAFSRAFKAAEGNCPSDYRKP